ncbi:hypothetical protein [Luteimonas salinilitoris]|uniref:DUF91 domain-containing protein n=1 Tax=Luteimonas salinilitoris TaxID=3237697 RepID=A0ABV4HPG0_9GAMM
MSAGALLGYVEREGVNLAEWMKSGSRAVNCAICDSASDQWELRSRLNARISEPDGFIAALERSVQEGNTVQFLVNSFGLDPGLVLHSMTGASANAAKGRWEGTDVDPDRRYRVALVGANEWSWSNAALEIVRRMGPSDLSLEVALLFAKLSDTGRWSRARAFVSGRSARRDELIALLKKGGIDDTRVVEVDSRGHRYATQPTKLNALRIRDSDAGEVEYEVSRPKRRVHDLVTNWLREWGVQQGLTISEGSDSVSLYDALVERSGKPHLLIEVKSSAGPGVVRLAVGQLIDYGRVLARNGIETHRVLLLPETEKLTEELKDLLKLAGFSWAVLLFRGANSQKIVLEIHRSDGTIEHIP